MADHSILAYGAAAGGEKLCTAVIQAAIDAASAAGGGRVVVPAGTFLTGTINLRSRITLQLDQGAVLLGSSRLEDYEFARGWGWPHDDQPCDVTPWHLVQAFDAECVRITGEGAIAGSGPAFWYPDRKHEWEFWVHRENQRPSPMVHIESCRHVLIEGVTLRDSAGWTLHLTRCEASRISGVTIRNPFFGPNTDGMDIHNCRGVTIAGCDIATGDDAIAIMASSHGGPSEDIAISDCVLRTSCVGLRIISFDSGGHHRRIVAANILMPRTSRMFDLRAQNGSTIENIRVANVVGTTNSGWPINRAFEIVCVAHSNPHTSRHNPQGKAALIRDVHLANVDVLTDGRGMVACNAPDRVENVTLSDIRMRYPMLDDPHVFEQSQDNHSHGMYLPGDNSDARGARAAVVAKNVHNLNIRNLEVYWPTYPVSEDWLTWRTPNRLINRAYFEGNEEAIRTGRLRPPFHAVWAKGLRGGRLDLRGLTASEGGDPAEGADCTCQWVR
jgi:hypothetical protein